MLEEFISNIIFLIVSLGASIVGAICGVGGGIIIKPVLDTIGMMSVSSISFLSGCTVLSMSIISVFKNMKNNSNKNMNLKISTLLGVGSAIGGILGSRVFQYLKILLNDDNKVGAVQALVLIIITIATLIYVKNLDKIKTMNVTNLYLCIFIGLVLGLISAFLGIGGGPINLVVLSYFFSMKTKTAAANSIYIIMFSQSTSFLSTLISKNIPDFNVKTLVVMILGGIAGGIIGNKINGNISTKKVDNIFTYLILIIISINLYNFLKFSI
ncbi:sulfite exporter TauE/SafE family protein [Clostridium sp.]|uniref:sulfite exporter TauE/SafE family protein n=1 Tax=Clostridium sp. TaxID=1506 RepID=UPI0025BC9CA6|nr:sulfite exporter TauE/SafE family protein [Clostridium sp.]